MVSRPSPVAKTAIKSIKRLFKRGLEGDLTVGKPVKPTFLQRLTAAAGFVLRGTGVPAQWFNRAGDQEARSNQLAQPFANSVWVMAAVKKVSGPISAVELCQINEQDQELEDPRLEAFWKAPALNADGSRMRQSDFLELCASWLCLAGEVFLILDDSWSLPFPELAPFGGYTPLVIGRPDRMRPLKNGTRLAAWEFTDATGARTTLRLEQVIQIKLFNPYDDLRGLGPLQAALIAAGGDYAAGVFAKNTADANGDQGVFIIAKNGVPDDIQREQIINQLREKRSAQQRGIFRPAFLTGDITIEDPKVRSVDVGFISQRVEARKEIAIAFGVPPSFFDPVASYSVGAASDRYILIEETCKPLGAKICGGLARIAERLVESPITCELDWDDHSVMQQVRRERIDSGIKLWNTGMPMSEVSDYLNLDLPEFPGWEVGYLPFSVAPVSASGETMPAPATDPALAEEEVALPNPVQEAIQALRGQPVAVRSEKSKVLWASHIATRRKTVKLMHAKVSKVLFEFRTSTLARLELIEINKSTAAQRSFVDLIFDPTAFGQRLVAQLTNPLTATLQLAGNELRSEIGLDDAWQMPPQKAKDYVAGRTSPLEKVGAEVRSQLNTALNEGLDAGESTKELAARVRAKFSDLSAYEAERVARTEVNMAYNDARHDAMKGAGIQYKAWLSSHGPHVRPSHAAAELAYIDSPIPVDEAFRVGGEELMFPGDDSLGASAGNIINCQCIQLAAEKTGEDEKSSTYQVHGFGSLTVKEIE